MWKVLIADDQPEIRQQLKAAINWAELDLELVGEAEDGEVAYAAASKLKPDIILIDICMPFLNGFQLINKLRGELKDSIIIVITTYEEYSWVQQAVKLQVCDYILKPVAQKQLGVMLSKARQQLLDKQAVANYLSWVSGETYKNVSVLRENFCKEWLSGGLTEAEIAGQQSFLGLELSSPTGLILMRATGRCSQGQLLKKWDKEILMATIENTVSDLLVPWRPYIVFLDEADNLVAITAITNPLAWNELGVKLRRSLEQQSGQVIVVVQRQVTDLVSGIPAAYQELCTEVNQKLYYTAS